MARFYYLMLFFLFITGCSKAKKSYTLKELQSEKWTTLAPGLDYISTSKGDGFRIDTANFAVLGILRHDSLVGKPDIAIIPEVGSILMTAIANGLPYSASGYLRVNWLKLVGISKISAMVYVSDSYSYTSSFAHDSAFLKSIPGIHSIAFATKEDAKKKFLSDGDNSSWDKVLDENPLPSSIEFTLAEKSWTDEEIKQLDRVIRDSIHGVTEVTLPLGFLTNAKDFSFFKYSRIENK